MATTSASMATSSVTNHWQKINCDNGTNENVLFQNHFLPQQNQLQQLKYFHMHKQPNNQYTVQVPGALQQQQPQCYLSQHYSVARQDTVHVDRLHNKVDKHGIVPYLQMSNPYINPNISLLNDNVTILNTDGISYQQQFLTDQCHDINFRQYQLDHQQQIFRANNDLAVPLAEMSLTTCFALKASYEGQVYVASFVDPTVVPYEFLSPLSVSCKQQIYVNAIEAVPDMLKDIRPILADIENFFLQPIFVDENQQNRDLHGVDRHSNISCSHRQKLKNFNWARFVRKNCRVVVPQFCQRLSLTSMINDVTIDKRNETCRGVLSDYQRNLPDAQKSYADVLQENEYKHVVSCANCKTRNEENEKKCGIQHGKEGVSACPSKRLYKMAESFCLEQLENLAFFRAFEPYDRSKKRLPYTEMFIYRSRVKSHKSNCGEIATINSNNVGSKHMYVSTLENRGSFKFLQKFRKKCSAIGSIREVTTWRTNYHEFTPFNY